MQNYQPISTELQRSPVYPGLVTNRTNIAAIKVTTTCTNITHSLYCLAFDQAYNK